MYTLGEGYKQYEFKGHVYKFCKYTHLTTIQGKLDAFIFVYIKHLLYLESRQADQITILCTIYYLNSEQNAIGNNN